MPVLINLHGVLQNFINTLLSQRRSIDNGKIDKRSKTCPYGIFESLNSLVRFIFYQIPLVDTNHQTLFIFLYQRKDIQILSFDTSCSIDHQNTNIRGFDSSYGANHRIIFEIFGNLPFLTNAGRIYQIKIESEFIVSGINRIASRTGNIGNNIPVFANKRIDDRRLSGIRASHHRKTRNVFLYLGFRFFGKTFQYLVQQIARSRTAGCRHTKRIAQPERIKFGGVILPLVRISFIRYQNHRFIRTA